MKKSNKKAVLLLSLVLILSIAFSACVNKKDSSSTPSTDTKDSTSTVGTGTSEGNATQEEKIHHLRLMGPSRFANFVKWDEREQFPSWNLFIQQLKERNIELEYEWIVPEQYATVIQTRMASALDLPDIANISPLDDMTLMLLHLHSIMEGHSKY